MIVLLQWLYLELLRDEGNNVDSYAPVIPIRTMYHWIISGQ